jgi:hypothetical protein
MSLKVLTESRLPLRRRPRPSFQYLTLFSEELVLFAQPAELLTLFGARAFALAMIDLCLSDPVA